MYGQWIPPLTQSAIDAKTAEYMVRDYTSGQVAIHFAHRLLAFGILIYGLIYFVMMLRKAREWSILLGPAFTMINLLFLQVILGILVIWTGDYPLNATIHQATGAALLAACVWAMIRIYLISGVDSSQFATIQSNASDQPSGSIDGKFKGGIEGGAA